MAVLHIFNPEHDIALAANLSNFTAPHAGRQLRHDLGYLPALWAGGDDYVLVENVEDARRDFARLMHRQFDGFIDKRQLSTINSKLSTLNSKLSARPEGALSSERTLNSNLSTIEPWGWDLALRSFLMRYGVEAVPTEDEIAVIRDLSHRKYAVDLLRALAFEGTTGTSWRADTMVEVKQALRYNQKIVVKAPWSSSGRGVRFIEEPVPMIQRWIENVIAAQGSVVIESYCHKVKDFGMEFESDGRGNVRYLGLSLFHTENGAYTGNILAPEEEKQEMINRYLSEDLLKAVREKICTYLGALYKGKYAGPFGVDMMVVRGDDEQNFLLNPCVEINLRRTMGHVALVLSNQCPSDHVMRIDYSDNTYKLRIKQI